MAQRLSKAQKEEGTTKRQASPRDIIITDPSRAQSFPQGRPIELLQLNANISRKFCADRFLMGSQKQRGRPNLPCHHYRSGDYVCLFSLRSDHLNLAQDVIFEVDVDERSVDLHLRLATTLIFLSHDLILQSFEITSTLARAISTMSSNLCHDE